MRQRQIGHGIHIISAHFCAPRQSGMRTCGFDQNQVSPQAIYPCSQRPLRGAFIQFGAGVFMFSDIGHQLRCRLKLPLRGQHFSAQTVVQQGCAHAGIGRCG